MGNKTLRHVTVPMFDFKYDNESGEFTCYGNVKNIIDHAGDRTVHGCFVKSIERHKAAGTMPKQLWMHNPRELPVGPWLDMKEDGTGLFLKGRLSDTTTGRDIRILAKDGALDSFSIGYIVNEERWNRELGCNDLIDVDVKEVSWVNFACNEASQLVEIKTRIAEGQIVTKAELRLLLESVPVGLSKRQIERITADYKPSTDEIDLNDLKSVLEKSPLFK